MIFHIQEVYGVSKNSTFNFGNQNVIEICAKLSTKICDRTFDSTLLEITAKAKNMITCKIGGELRKISINGKEMANGKRVMNIKRFKFLRYDIFCYINGLFSSNIYQITEFGIPIFGENLPDFGNAGISLGTNVLLSLDLAPNLL